MSKTTEQLFLTALASRDYDQAHQLLQALAVILDPIRLRFLHAVFQTGLSPMSLPEAFMEMMDVAREPKASLQTLLQVCVEAGYIAGRLHDPGRIHQVSALFRSLLGRFPNHPLVKEWTGPVLLNQANMAYNSGDLAATHLYEAAADSLEMHDRFWSMAVAANARLAVCYESTGRSDRADQALDKARALMKGEGNKQELDLGRARVLLYREEHASAIRAAAQALLEAAKQEDHYVTVEALRVWGKANLAQGRYGLATARLAEAHQMALAYRLYSCVHRIVLDMRLVS